MSMTSNEIFASLYQRRMRKKYRKSLHSTLVKCRKILRDILRGQQEYLVYKGVSSKAYRYIMDRLESDECPQTCNKHFKVSFLRHSQRLMVSYPFAARGMVLNAAMRGLWRIQDTIPISVASDLDFEVSLNSTCCWGESIDTAPDLMVKMWSKSRENPRHVPRTMWLMESASNESDGDVMDKLRAYVHDVPGLLVVAKILFKEATPYHSPGSRGSTVKRLRLSERMTQSEWARYYMNPQEYLRVVVDDYTWFSLSSVEFHVWIRKLGESKIDLDSLSGDGYAFGRLYPTVDFDDVDSAFQRSFELMKATILHDLPDVDLHDWLLPTRVIEPEDLVRALERGAWATAYHRYWHWHNRQKKRRRRTSRACASDEASSLLNSVQLPNASGGD